MIFNYIPLSILLLTGAWSSALVFSFSRQKETNGFLSPLPIARSGQEIKMAEK